MKSKHGILRGLDSPFLKKGIKKAIAPSFEGKFGRIFPTLPKANHAETDLDELAKLMVAKADVPPTDETESDDEENAGISAGYTYLGQFIDHDITFDPASSLQKANDLDALIDYRTPRLDLDNIYGRGPDDQPYMYDEDGLRFLLGQKIGGNPEDPNTHDLVRNNPGRGAHRAIIGDPRNDENQIVSQLQGMFHRFHNSIVDLKKGLGEAVKFSEVQQLVRWHYQWLVVNDFLPTIIKKEVIENIFPHLTTTAGIQGKKPKLTLFGQSSEPFMPVEFSVAAYRFGHSMIRPVYRLNQHRHRFFIFPDLTGFDTVADDLAIDWKLFFDFGNNPNPKSSQRIQPAYKIDTSLVDPLGHLPAVIASHPSSLAARNLRRGLTMELPSGQEVARALKVPVIPDSELKIGKANIAGSKPGKDQNKSIADLTKLSTLKDNAPLWFYILAEALHDFNSHKPVDDNTPVRLGNVGGRIVGEVFAWLLVTDPTSVVYAKDENGNDWKPIPDFTREGKFGISELLTQAQKS